MPEACGDERCAPGDQDVASACTPHERYRSGPKFGALDGLRALAAAAVVWHHSGHQTGIFARNIGVTTFFVLSGFLITRLLLRERLLTGTVSLRRFWTRRALRILPLYFGVLALYVVLVAIAERGTVPGQRFWASLPYYATLTTNWFVSPAQTGRIIFFFAWSLAVQEQFYLMWPAFIRRIGGTPTILLPLFFFLCADASGWALDSGYIRSDFVHWVLLHLDSPIYLGVLLAVFLDSRTGFRIAQRLAGRPWSLPVSVALVVASGEMPRVPQPLFELGVAYVVTSCVLAPRWAARVLDNAAMRHVGNVSYGIYLLHMLMLNTVHRVLPGSSPAFVFALGFPLTVAAATATRRWFEQPFLEMRRTLRAPSGRNALTALDREGSSPVGSG